MLRFLLKLALFALCLALLGSLFFFVISPRIPFDLSDYVSRWEEKMARLRECPEGMPRLVIVGGSNCYYGIEDDLISAALSNRYHVVNMGLHAGLGLGRMLEEVAPYLKKGDIVCLAAEYDHYVKESYSGGAVAIAFMIDYKQKPRALFFSRQYAGTPHMGWTSYSQFKVKHMLGSRNNCGAGVADLAAVLPVPKESYSQKRIEKQHSWQLNEASFKWLSRFAADMRERGCRVVFSAPAFDGRCFGLYKDDIAVIRQALEELGFECISDAAEYAFPLEFMYDTEYHLNARGRTNRTERLIRDIERANLDF